VALFHYIPSIFQTHSFNILLVIYVLYGDSDSHMSDCDEEICIGRMPTLKNKKKGLKSHCFRCDKFDHVVQHCPDHVERSGNNRSLGNRIIHFCTNSLFQRPKQVKTCVPVLTNVSFSNVRIIREGLYIAFGMLIGDALSI